MGKFGEYFPADHVSTIGLWSLEYPIFRHTLISDSFWFISDSFGFICPHELSVTSTLFISLAYSWIMFYMFGERVCWFWLVSMGRLFPFKRRLLAKTALHQRGTWKWLTRLYPAIFHGWCWKWTGRQIFSFVPAKLLNQITVQQPAARLRFWWVLQPEWLWYTKKFFCFTKLRHWLVVWNIFYFPIYLE